MPYYGVETTLYYKAWDSSAGAYKTGDAANHSLYVNKDGSASAATNSPAEVDASNQPGLYKITLTATEMQAIVVALGGNSSTSNVTLHFTDVGPLHLPNAAPASNGGLGTVNASNQIAGIAGTIQTLDALDTAQDTQHSTTRTKLQRYAALIARKDAAAATDFSAELGELNVNGGSGAGAYDNTTDSTEAIRDRGDAAWATGTTFGASLNITPLIPQDIGLADTATYRIGLMLVDAIDDLPSTAEITPGTISIERKAPAGTSWTSVVSDAACSELAGLIYYDEVFDDGTGYAEGDELKITFKSQKITVNGNDHEITDSNGRIFYARIGQQSLVSGKLSLITSATTLSTVASVADGGVITIGQGETKVYADGNAIRFDIDGTTTDLTGFTPKLALTKQTSNSGSASVEVSGTVVNAGAADQFVYFELNNATTAAMALDTSIGAPFATNARYAYTFVAGATDGVSSCPDIAKGWASVYARGITCS